VLTYSDDVLYNWEPRIPNPSGSLLPEVDNLRSQTLFTGTTDEQEFYLSSSRIEILGVRALSLMRQTMDELFVGDDIAARRVTSYLRSLSTSILEMKDSLLTVKEGVNPDVFYREIRPWFKGQDSNSERGPWVFEGISEALAEDPSLDLEAPTELSGPSAGQSALIHALDIFLGVDKHSHDSTLTGSASNQESFLSRMQKYMPRHHRAFLTHLSSTRYPLRPFVLSQSDSELTEAFNEAVGSMKKFRDAHMQIIALYIIVPARKVHAGDAKPSSSSQAQGGGKALKGTGGTDLVRFLKDVRDKTVEATIREEA
jgi:indoleamine 2,3-dioxygenase